MSENPNIVSPEEHLKGLELTLKHAQAGNRALQAEITTLQTALTKHNFLLEHGPAAYMQKLEQELVPLKEFARKVIKLYCWSIEDSDPLDLQELAEKLGLIVPTIATEDMVDDESDFEVGDAIFTYSDILKGDIDGERKDPQGTENQAGESEQKPS